MNLTTTIEKVYSHRPCSDWFAELILNILWVSADPESPIKTQIELLTQEQRTVSITLLQILDSNGIHYALWVLRCWDYHEYCLLLADIIEPSGQYSDYPAVRNMATTIRRWHAGGITAADLEAMATRAADAVIVEVAWAEEAVWAAAAAARAADAAAVAAAAAAAAAAAWADAERAADVAMDSEWSRIEQLMRDFCAEKEKVTE